MPSRFEPCGLNQMYSLKYGTVPVVRAVGGLDDTIDDWNPRTETGTGFKFTDYTPEALRAALRKALELYRTPDSWEQIQRAGMARDHSWDASAAEYVKVYEKAIKARNRRPRRESLNESSGFDASQCRQRDQREEQRWHPRTFRV